MEKLKRTKSRCKIIDIISKSNKPITANEIYSLVKDDGITLSTIYRTLATFTDNDIISKDITESNESVYSAISNEHFHYLECKKCHKQIKIDYCPYDDKVLKKIKKEKGFIIDERKIVYGICPDCQDK